MASSWKTYCVVLERTERASVEVKARNSNEAMRKAEENADDTLFEGWNGAEAVDAHRVRS